MRGAWKVKEAEVLSLRAALIWAKELGLDQCVFESDWKNLVNAYKQELGDSYFHTLVSDCVASCEHFDNVQIVFARRSANCVAHVLVTRSLSDPRE